MSSTKTNEDWKNPGASIPADWKNSHLSQVTLKISDRDHTTPIYVSANDGIPIVSPTNLTDDMRLDLSKLKYITPEAHAKNRKKTDLLPDDIIFSRIGAGLGKSYLLKDSFYNFSILHSFCQIRPSDAILPQYLLWFLRSDFLQWRLKHGIQSIGVPDLGLGEIGELPVFHPLDKLEQQKIAAILTAVDDVIESTQAQINKLKDLKTGMMQELLTKGIGHTEFKDSPIGTVPETWGSCLLGDLIDSLEGGVSVNGENRPCGAGEFGVLKVSAVQRGKFFPSENKTILKSDLHRAILHPMAGNILFSRANTPELVGESGYVEKTRMDLFLPDKLWSLKIKVAMNVHTRWLSYVLSSGKTRERISEAGTGTSGSMKNISKPNLLSIRIPFPPYAEQEAIANVLLSLDKRIDSNSERFTRYETVKKALMQDLLTGKVRVQVN